ncbi:MAG: restriction endonuclease subunit S [Flavobacteriaceae bacterium]|nr:restriction endonuclease subunit S [Flavobacteriaceae bacterium]
MHKVILDDVLKYEQPTKYIVETENYNNNFKTPVLTAGKSFILGYTDEENGIFTDVPVIIFDDFTTAFHYVDFPFKVKSSAMKILKSVKEKADLRFLYYKMQTIYIDKDLHKRYWISKYSQIQIPLPDLPTQQKIAKILDKADELRQYNQQLIAKYDALTQSLFLDMFGDPVKNEKGWEKKGLKNFGKISTGNTPSRADAKNYDNDHIEWIKTDNIKENIIYVTEANEYLSEKGLSKGRSVNAGSILVACIAGSIESIGRVALTNRKVSFNQQINAIEPNSNVNSQFLYYLIKSSRKHIQNHASNGMKRMLTKGEFEKIIIILPPINLQNKFAERIQLIEAQKQQAQEALVKSELLFQGLLQQAFNGELS